jgi:hypothetical protein
MVKSVVLACVLALASTAAFAAGTSTASKKSASAPATPKAEGWCPIGCAPVAPKPVAPKPQGLCPFAC